ncbi:MAG: SufD family Fe-S cluster assembly protein [Bacilli bacterium]|nr:SufD family Fe-S cluster assembly protein [Bacilli bacterium]
MNKLIVNGDEITSDINKTINVNIKEKTDIYDVTKIEIEVLKNTELVIEYINTGITKLDINIKVLKNVEFKLYELKEENEIKVQYKYYLEEFSNMLVNKFYDCNKIKELVLIYLNGINSEINYNFNTISKDKQKIDLMVYHNNKNTISNITNKAVNMLNGSTTFNITGLVYNKINDCIINQNNRIINLNDKKCTINPILLIDENDVEANHSAIIGKFSDKELFYLMSRGINKEKALNLLIKGFLAIDIKSKNKIKKIIDKYWR